MGSRLLWMTLEGDCLWDTPQSLAVTVPFPPMYTLAPSQNTFKTVMMTRVNGQTNSPMSGMAFLPCAVRKDL